MRHLRLLGHRVRLQAHPCVERRGERAELNKIALRVADAKLAYGTDEDVFGNDPIGIDPGTNRWDFASDPLPWYKTRTRLVHELWGNLETKLAQPGKGYQRLRRVGPRDDERQQVHRRHLPSPRPRRRPGNRSPYEPVAAKTSAARSNS